MKYKTDGVTDAATGTEINSHYFKETK